MNENEIIWDAVIKNIKNNGFYVPDCSNSTGYPVKEKKDSKRNLFFLCSSQSKPADQTQPLWIWVSGRRIKELNQEITNLPRSVDVDECNVEQKRGMILLKNINLVNWPCVFCWLLKNNQLVDK